MEQPDFQKLDKQSLDCLGTRIGLEFPENASKRSMIAAILEAWAGDSNLFQSGAGSDGVTASIPGKPLDSGDDQNPIVQSQTVGQSDRVSFERRCMLWCSRNWKFWEAVNPQAQNFALAVGTVALAGIGLLTLYVSYNENAKNTLKQQELDLTQDFNSLIATEDRYRTHTSPLTINDDFGQVSPFKLEVAASENGDSFEVFFRLPRFEKQIGTRIETRDRTVSLKGKDLAQHYNVVVPVYATVPVLADVSAFGCVSCNSRERLDVYLDLKASTSGMNLSPFAYVHFARGAVDFGELSVAKGYLSLASSKLGVLDSVVELARLHEEIGKTYMVMKEFQEAENHLDAAKALWRSTKLDSQVGGLHDVLNWQAQFVSASKNQTVAQRLLEEMSSVLQTYDLSESKTHQMIHDSYAACLTLLANAGEYDPKLSVPPEYLFYQPALGGWVSPHQAVETYRQTEFLPTGIVIVQSVAEKKAAEVARHTKEQSLQFEDTIGRILSRLGEPLSTSGEFIRYN